MTPCFADTFYFIALLNPLDQAHGRAVVLSQETRRPVVTTTWVLLELANYLAGTPSRALCGRFIQYLHEQTRVEIIPATEEYFSRGLSLYDARPDKQWSLTDCLSFVVMQDMQLTEALTGDHHFEQAGFKALLVV